MRPASYKALRSVSLLIFVLSVLLFVSCQLVDVASRRVQVRDKAGQIVGEAWIPHDYGTDQFVCLSMMILSGIQFWTVLYFGKVAHDRQK
jgi:hypothetical protein